MELLKDKVYNDWVKGYLYSKQNKRCIGCLDEYSKRNMEIDHIEPKSKGGTDDPSNLQLLCSTCNRMKGTSSQAVFLAKTAHLRVGKSTEGMDFDSSKLETHSEHDWSFKEVAEEILAEVGMPKKEIHKTIKRLYPHGFLPNVKLEDAEIAARIYEEKQEEKQKKIKKAKEKAEKKRAEDQDREEAVERLMDQGLIESALSKMNIDDSVYLGWAHGTFIKTGKDRFVSKCGSFNTKQAIEYLESI